MQDYYDGNDKPRQFSDLVKLFKDASKRHVHGNRDNDKYDENGSLITNKASERLELLKADQDLVCHCRYITRTMLDLLNNKLKIKSREVEFIAEQYRENDTRHTVFETLFNGRYFHVDIDVGVMFCDDGEYWNSLRLKDAFYPLKISKENIIRLTDHKRIHPDFTGEYVEVSLAEKIKDDEKLIEWYKHKSSAILIEKYIYTTGSKEKIHENLVDSIKGQETFLNRDDFEKRFYASSKRVYQSFE